MHAGYDFGDHMGVAGPATDNLLDDVFSGRLRVEPRQGAQVPSVLAKNVEFGLEPPRPMLDQIFHFAIVHRSSLAGILGRYGGRDPEQSRYRATSPTNARASFSATIHLRDSIRPSPRQR
ncbi:hypothetical protein BDI01nite_28740 [Brevundimonas diminuta]|nr:hypothetical protein BDI01nite_28740 [Brevundimonas diminuta]